MKTTEKKIAVEVELPKGYKAISVRVPKVGEKFLNENSTFAFADRSARVLECKNPSFDRIRVILEELEKPETLQERIEKQYPEFEVVRLGWLGNRLIIPNWKDRPSHIEAQSIRNFAGYIYDRGEGIIMETLQPVTKIPDGEGYKAIHPVAVLFRRWKND